MDSYWAGLAEFLTSAPAGFGVSLAPRSVAEAIPALTPFEEWDRFQIINRVIVHKGLVGEIPNGLLQGLFGTARSSFANEVFVVYEITPTKDDHVRAAEAALAENAVSGGMRAASSQRSGQTLLRKPRATPYASCRRRVVAALQSPTLLNNWARSKKWDLQVAEIGDHEGLSEASLLSVAKWDGAYSDIVAVLVTTPAQLANAARAFPSAKRIWIPHNGQGHLIPRQVLEQIDGIVTLSRKVLDLQRTQIPELLEKPAWTIPPSYVPTHEFGWSENAAWSMKSRPGTRHEYDLALFAQCQERASKLGIQIKLFGQDTPGGFLGNNARAALYKSCSCYVSALPPWAGFGLAQHECMAAGVPVAGLYWGDVGERYGRKYPALVDDLDSLAEVVKELCGDRKFAMRVSEAGHGYIEQCFSPMAMDQAIEQFIEEINGS